ncbi:MAG: hypothetical protein ACD_45C00622G0013 [uncultured bacterium]|nr:MAG: hypothetical protein ACD_45C00622G0013 [uncultured bacterium]
MSLGLSEKADNRDIEQTLNDNIRLGKKSIPH